MSFIDALHFLLANYLWQNANRIILYLAKVDRFFYGIINVYSTNVWVL